VISFNLYQFRLCGRTTETDTTGHATYQSAKIWLGATESASENFALLTRIKSSGVRGGVQGCKRTTNNFDFSKIRTISLTIGAKSLKIRAKMATNVV